MGLSELLPGLAGCGPSVVWKPIHKKNGMLPRLVHTFRCHIGRPHTIVIEIANAHDYIYHVATTVKRYADILEFVTLRSRVRKSWQYTAVDFKPRQEWLPGEDDGSGFITLNEYLAEQRNGENSFRWPRSLRDKWDCLRRKQRYS